MKRLRVDLYCGRNGEAPAYRTALRQLTDETPEDFIERITNVLFENIEQLTSEDEGEDE